MAILFNLLKRFWLWFSTCWKNSGYGFQPVEKNLAMLFNLLKNLWLCFSTHWKHSGYVFQPVEKNMAMLFNFWKVIFYEFQVFEKFSWMVFRAWKVQKSLTVSLPCIGYLFHPPFCTWEYFAVNLYNRQRVAGREFEESWYPL